MSGPRNRRIFSLWFSTCIFGRIEIQTRFDVATKAVVGKEESHNPSPHRRIRRAPVALGVLHVVSSPKFSSRVRIGSRDDVPPRTAAADVIEGS